jgi:hypothetical protein
MQVHRMYFHYSEYPPSLRVLFTGALVVLGTAYLFAMIQTFVTHAGRDGKPGLSVHDLVHAYSGDKESSRLEAALRGPMIDNIEPDDATIVLQWVHDGANEETFGDAVQGIFEDNCVACHNPEDNPHLPNLADFEVIKNLVKVDTGASIITLVRVSHIHLFGITFIFFIMGFIFSHALIRPVWLKCAVVGVPFVFIVLDIFSWYLTKLNPMFAWVIYIGGMFMALSFAFMWITSMYQMWIMKPPTDLERSTIG